VQLARSLAAEWGSQSGKSHIRVNSLSPGYIETPLTAGARAKPELLKQWISESMLGRISLPEEYRAPVLFLLGDGSSFMTGHALRVDGGHCAW
jgi:NAD(P)-dependent dehydrogenase (short-subunit alcohol dehydrogenase family)